jgi:hypothetical protein
MDGSCVVKNAFSERGFARVNVRRDADVSDVDGRVCQMKFHRVRFPVFETCCSPAENEKALVRHSAFRAPGDSSKI